MTTQLDLFSGVSDTSKKAYAEIIVSGTRQTLRQKVLGIIMAYPQLSRGEIAQRFGITLQSVCGRVNELLKVGEIKETGTRIDAFSRKTVYYLEANKNK